MEVQNLHKVTERIWYMDATKKSDRPSIGYIKGDDFSVMVDAGNSPQHVELFYERLKENSLPLPSLCLITHWHWDHTFGISGLDIPCVCPKKAAEYLQDFKGNYMQWYNGDEWMRAEYPNHEDIHIVVPRFTFTDEISIDLGGVTVKSIFVGGPHSDDSAIIFIPEEKFIFAGDSSSGDFSLPNIAYDIPRLDAYEDRLRSLDFKLFLHSHQAMMTREETFTFLDEGRKRGYYILEP